MKTFFRQTSVAAALLTGALVAVEPASAQNNPAPVGNVIFSLDGQAIPHTYTTYTATYTANSALTNLAFAFREDPAYFSIDNITFGLASGGANLLVNGDFELGPVGSNTPVGWSYLNLYGASAAGVVRAGCGTGGSNCYYDGAVGSYDVITQGIATVIGAQYRVSFDLTDNSSQAIASALAGGGLSGINMVVYADAANPTSGAVPEPATWAMMLMGFGGLGFAMRRRSSTSTRIRFA